MNWQCKALSRAAFSLRSCHTCDMWLPNWFGHWYVGTEAKFPSWKCIAHPGVGQNLFQHGIQHAPSKLHIFPMCCYSGAHCQKSSFLLRLSRTGRLSFGLTVGGIKTCIPQGGLASDFSRPFSLAFWQVRSGQQQVVCLTPVWSVPASCSMMLSHPLDSLIIWDLIMTKIIIKTSRQNLLRVWPDLHLQGQSFWAPHHELLLNSA